MKDPSKTSHLAAILASLGFGAAPFRAAGAAEAIISAARAANGHDVDACNVTVPEALAKRREKWVTSKMLKAAEWADVNLKHILSDPRDSPSIPRVTVNKVSRDGHYSRDVEIPAEPWNIYWFRQRDPRGCSIILAWLKDGRLETFGVG